MDVCHVCGHPYEPGTMECPNGDAHPSREMAQAFRHAPARYVYVSGPYDVDDEEQREQDSRVAVLAGLILARAGYVPVVPHMMYSVEELFDDRLSDDEHRDWRMAMMEKCDAVVVLDLSHEVRIDLAHAAGLGLPVYHGIKAFLDVHGENE